MGRIYELFLEKKKKYTENAQNNNLYFDHALRAVAYCFVHFFLLLQNTCYIKAIFKIVFDIIFTNHAILK